MIVKPKERQAKIMDTVRQQGQISVETLCERFSSSPETIRRDLAKLSSQGKLHKFHGGAKLPSTVGEGPFRQRMAENTSAKRIIAQQAALLIEPGNTLFIDTGSTTLILAEEITDIDGLTIVTNSLEIIKLLGDAKTSTFQLFLLGGEYCPNNREITGHEAIQQLNHFHAHHAFITVGCLDAKAGATDFNFKEAQMARAMMSRSLNVNLLADSSKFGKNAGYEVGHFNQFDRLICEHPPEATLMNALQKENVDVIHPKL